MFGVWHVASAAATGDAGQGPILVLGHRLRPDGQRSAAFRARLARAAALSQADLARRVLLLGGASRSGQGTDAAVGRVTLLAHGVPAARIEVEERSRHTLENLRGVRAALHAGGGQKPTLVTSRAHLARMARGMGIGCLLCAAEPALDAAAVRAIPREAFLLHWYVTGRLIAWLIRSRQLAARVT